MAVKVMNYDDPFVRTRIFIGIRRAVVMGYDFEALLRTQSIFSLPYKFLGDYELLRGRVNKIVKYPDGTLVFVHREPGSTSFDHWGEIPLWISPLNQSGVLAVWDTNTTPRRVAA